MANPIAGQSESVEAVLAAAATPLGNSAASDLSVQSGATHDPVAATADGESSGA